MHTYDIILMVDRYNRETWRVDLWKNGEPVFANLKSDHPDDSDLDPDRYGKVFKTKEKALSFIGHDAANRGLALDQYMVIL